MCIREQTGHSRGRRTKAIKGIYEQIDQVLSSLAPDIEEDTHEIPAFLRQLLPLGGSGSREPQHRARLKSASASRSGASWRFDGEFTNARPPKDAPWSFQIRLEVDQEGGGTKTLVHLDELEVPGCEVLEISPGYALIQVPPGCGEANFSGLTSPISVPKPELVSLKRSARIISNKSRERQHA